MYAVHIQCAFMQSMEEQLSKARRQLSDSEHRLELAERSKVISHVLCSSAHTQMYMYMYMYGHTCKYGLCFAALKCSQPYEVLGIHVHVHVHL